MKQLTFLALVALIGLLVSSVGCTPKRSEAARTKPIFQQVYLDDGENLTSVDRRRGRCYLVPDESNLPATDPSLHNDPFDASDSTDPNETLGRNKPARKKVVCPPEG